MITAHKTTRQLIADCRECERAFVEQHTAWTKALDTDNRGAVNKQTYAYSASIVDLQAAYESLTVMHRTSGSVVMVVGITPAMRMTHDYEHRYQVTARSHRGFTSHRFEWIDDALAAAVTYAENAGDKTQADYWRGFLVSRSG